MCTNGYRFNRTSFHTDVWEPLLRLTVLYFLTLFSPLPACSPLYKEEKKHDPSEAQELPAARAGRLIEAQGWKGVWRLYNPSSCDAEASIGSLGVQFPASRLARAQLPKMEGRPQGILTRDNRIRGTPLIALGNCLFSPLSPWEAPPKNWTIFYWISRRGKLVGYENSFSSLE